MQTHRRAIEQYIMGKDGNRPDLLRQAFTPDARVKMVVRTDAIAFPTDLTGLPAIAQTLSRGFNQTYENIYTFCLGAAPSQSASAHTCKWLVGMSVKSSGEVRVGCGQYDWQFDPESALVTDLIITIEHMQVSPAHDLEPVMDWLQGLDYPWCEVSDVIAQAPKIASFEPVLAYLLSPSALA